MESKDQQDKALLFEKYEGLDFLRKPHQSLSALD